MSSLVSIIFSRNKDNVIGVDNDLLTKIPSDLRRFKNITKNNALIMGYNTWMSLPKKPLPNRLNIVLSKKHKMDIEESDEVHVCSSIEEAIHFVDRKIYPKIFVIGGSNVFKELLDKHSEKIDCVYETITDTPYEPVDGECVHNFDPKKIQQGKHYLIIKSENVSGEVKGEHVEDISCQFNIFQSKSNVNWLEYEYLHKLRYIREYGTAKGSRNSEVLSSFGEKMTFDLRLGFPLLTTKKMGWKTILRELLWFISGSTSNKVLQSKNVHIWDQNASKEYMNTRGLSYEEGDLGPIYGFQWRHFGDTYMGMDHNHTGGVDQIKEVIRLIKEEPTSRRIILSAWNPCDLDKMSLPPCHILTQFNIEGKYIDAQLYQRSGDMFLGVPYNIASYSMLLHIIGKITGYIPRFLHHVIGDCHIYKSHVDAVDLQIYRVPHPPPTIEISDISDIDKVSEEDIRIINYTSDPTIRANMIV